MTNGSFPPDREEELLELIRNHGSFKDAGALADYFEVPRKVLSQYLRSPAGLAARQEFYSRCKQTVREQAEAYRKALRSVPPAAQIQQSDLLDENLDWTIIAPYSEGLFKKNDD